MSLALSQAFVGFGSGGLESLEAASGRRFQRFILAAQQEQLDAQIRAQNDLVNSELEGQRALVEIQQTAMNGLTEAVGLLYEAQQEMQRGEEEWRADEARAREAAVDAIKGGMLALEGTFKAIVDKIGVFVDTMYNQAVLGVSAGGSLVGLTLENRVRNPWRGIPFATGDWLLTFNGARAGWLLCDGHEVRRDEYPNLARLIGGLYGAASSGDFFKLPTKAQITNDAVMLANNRANFIIRT